MNNKMTCILTYIHTYIHRNIKLDMLKISLPKESQKKNKKIKIIKINRYDCQTTQ